MALRAAILDVANQSEIQDLDLRTVVAGKGAEPGQNPIGGGAACHRNLAQRSKNAGRVLQPDLDTGRHQMFQCKMIP
jgi:hypothetical protein